MNWKRKSAWRFSQAQTVNPTTTKRYLTFLAIAAVFIATSGILITIVVKAQEQKASALRRESDAGSTQQVTPSVDPVRSQYEKVLHIGAEMALLPFSSGGLDVEPHGPASLSVTSDGNFLIANQANNSALELSRSDGSVVSKTNFANAEALTDAIALNGRFYALDHNNGSPRILVAEFSKSRSAAQVETVESNTVAEVRSESVPTRLSLQDDQLVVDTIAGGKISALDGVSTVRQATTVPVVTPGNAFGVSPRQLEVSVRGKRIVNLTMQNAIAQADLLGVGSSGDFFVYVIELGGDQRLLLDHKVLHFATSGKLLDQARVPADERAFAVANGTALAEDGNVYSLIPRVNGDTDIVRLVFGRTLPAFNPDVSSQSQPAEAAKSLSMASAVQSQVAAATAVTSLPQLSRNQMTTNAWNIVNSTFYHSAVNIGTSSSCSTRAIPAYLKNKSAGWYQEAYAWGKADMPSDYNWKLGQGYLAGNAQSQSTSCNVTGTDCSGFLGNCWQLYGHPFSTDSLPTSGIVRSISRSNLTSGDILNWQTKHVMMFDRSDLNSLWVWEATTDHSTGRVGYNQRAWSEVPSTAYLAWRYNGLPKPTAGITLNSSWGIAYENSNPVYTVSPGQTINFSLSSSRSVANSGTLVSWLWKVNGSVISTQPSTSRTLGPGTYTVSLQVTNSEGDSATASLTIQINQVTILLPPRIDYTNPSYVRRGVGTWLAVYGANFQRTMTVQVRTATGGPWVIASSGVSYINSGMVWVYVVMGGSGTYTAWLEIVQNGAVASRAFTVGP
jgi:hypothetical protein